MQSQRKIWIRIYIEYLEIGTLASYPELASWNFCVRLSGTKPNFPSGQLPPRARRACNSGWCGAWPASWCPLTGRRRRGSCVGSWRVPSATPPSSTPTASSPSTPSTSRGLFETIGSTKKFFLYPQVINYLFRFSDCLSNKHIGIPIHMLLLLQLIR